MSKLLCCIILLGVIFIPKIYFAQNNFEGGLLLTGNYNLAYNQKTSIQLTPNSPINLKEKFEISFDLSFWDTDEYGAIIQAKDKDGLLNLDLLNIYYKSRDSIFFKLMINNIDSKILMPALKSDFIRNNWNRISLKFNLTEDKVYGSINDKILSSADIKLPDELNMYFFSGLFDFYGECTRSAIKNISIKDENNKIINYWKLNEFEGNKIKDYAGNSDGVMSNGEWLLKKRAVWEKFAEFDTRAFFKPSVAFNDKKSIIYIVDSLFLYKYHLLNGNLEKIKLQKGLSTEYLIIYNNIKNELYSYYRGGGEVSKFREQNKSWEKVDTSKENGKDYFGHGSFINFITGDLIMIGGYGWFTAKNHIRKYNFDKKNWEIIKTKGDFFTPRYANFSEVSIGKDTSKNSVYIFNGYGNNSGQQESAFHELLDLYKLNLKDYYFKKIYKIKNDIPEFSIASNIIYDKNNDVFYAIGKKFSLIENEKHKVKYEKIYLLSISKTKPEIKIINEYDNKNIDENPFSLIYSEKTKELIFATYLHKSGGQKIILYKILFPTLTKEEVEKITTTKKSLIAKFVYITFALGVIVLVFAFILKRRKKNNKKVFLEKEISENQLSENIVAEKEQNLSNSICLFGNFEVIDKNGNDISDQFKPKLRQLFLLILVNSKGNKGITSEKLTVILWPEADNTQAKNNRNASISRLRNILSKVEGVEILHQNNKWIIEITDKLSLDIKTYHELKSKLKNDFVKSDLNRFINLISKGRFLNDIDYEWLDSIKFDIISEVIEISLSITGNEKVKDDDELLLKLSDAILIWDSVNEKAIKLKINALTNLGRNGEAKLAYENFVLNYSKIFESDYKFSFQELLDDKNI